MRRLFWPECVLVCLLGASCASTTTAATKTGEIAPTTNTTSKNEISTSAPSDTLATTIPKASDSRLIRDPDQPRLLTISGRITADGKLTSGEVSQYAWPFGASEGPDASESQAELVTFNADGVELERMPILVGQRIQDYIEQVPYEPGLHSIPEGRLFDADDAGELADLTSRQYDLSFRVSLADSPLLHTVAIELAGEEVWRISASSHAPEVRLEVEGTIVRWHVSDPDGDSVDVLAYYSADGGETWQVVGGGHMTENGGPNWVDVANAKVPGSDAGIVALFATDGFHFTAVDSPAIAVTQAPPEIHFDWPEEGYSVNRSSWVLFEVAVGMPGQGMCIGACDVPPGVSVVWTSNLDGEFGSGLSFELFPATDTGQLPLRPGTHEITVTVSDSHGHSVSETRPLTIAAS